MPRQDIYLDGIGTQYKAEPNSLPLIFLGGTPEEAENVSRLSHRMTGVKLQRFVEDALRKIPKGKRAKFLRCVITQAIIKQGLLEEGTYEWSPDCDFA